MAAKAPLHKVVVHLDRLLEQRGMTLTELAERVDVTIVNLSILKNGRARAIRFSTLTALCEALECQPATCSQSNLGRNAERRGMRIPLKFLWDRNASGGVKLGIPLVSVARAVALFSLSRILGADFLRRLGGVVLLGATALFVVQLGRRLGWDNLNDDLGVGPYLAGAGGLLALLAPPGMWPFVRRRVPVTF